MSRLSRASHGSRVRHSSRRLHRAARVTAHHVTRSTSRCHVWLCAADQRISSFSERRRQSAKKHVVLLSDQRSGDQRTFVSSGIDGLPDVNDITGMVDPDMKSTRLISVKRTSCKRNRPNGDAVTYGHVTRVLQRHAELYRHGHDTASEFKRR